MIKKWIILFFSLSLLNPIGVTAKPHPPFQIAATRNDALNKIEKVVNHWEARMASDEVKENPYLLFKQKQGISFRDLRHKTVFPFYKDLHQDASYPALYKRVLSVRKKLAQKGMSLGHWKMWKFDQIDLSPQEVKIVASMDKKIGRFRGWSRKGRGYDERIVKEFNELKKRLSHPAINKGNLKIYKSEYFYPQVQGLDYLLIIKEQDFVGDRWREVRQRIKTRSKGSQVHLKQIKGLANKTLKVLNILKAQKVNLNQQSYFIDKRDVLSENKTLAQIEVELKKVLRMK